MWLELFVNEVSRGPECPSTSQLVPKHTVEGHIFADLIQLATKVCVTTFQSNSHSKEHAYLLCVPHSHESPWHRISILPVPPTCICHRHYFHKKNCCPSSCWNPTVGSSRSHHCPESLSRGEVVDHVLAVRVFAKAECMSPCCQMLYGSLELIKTPLNMFEASERGFLWVNSVPSSKWSADLVVIRFNFPDSRNTYSCLAFQSI